MERSKKNKLRYDLIPTFAHQQLAKVLTVGCDIFEDETFKTSFIPKVGLNEAFWNWRDLGTSNVQCAGYGISLNGDPDATGQVNSGRKDVYAYGSVIFDYYIFLNF